jgi:hypothetical protein
MHISLMAAVVVTAEDMGEEWPDSQRSAAAHVMRPESVLVMLADNLEAGQEGGGSGRLAVESVQVRGHRVLKDGGSGKYMSEEFLVLGRDIGLDEWLQRAARAALKAAEDAGIRAGSETRKRQNAEQARREQARHEASHERFTGVERSLGTLSDDDLAWARSHNQKGGDRAD